MSDKLLKPPELKANCLACSALCCVVLPFDADQGFGFDKEANTPCKNLLPDFSCGIHANLHEKGFRGCTRYDCHGAGQRATAMFKEVNWSSHPAQANDIYLAFKQLEKLHELQSLLQTAASKIAEDSWQQRLVLQQHIVEQAAVELEQGNAIELSAVTETTLTLLRQLATAPAIVALRAKTPN